MLSIRIPKPCPVEYREARRPVPRNYYKNWTAADYAREYRGSNKPSFSWGIAVTPRRSPRLALLERINYRTF